MQAAREKAYEISRQVLWNSLITYYRQTYDYALQQVAKRIDQFVKIEERPSEAVQEYVVPTELKPTWKKIIVKSKLPDAFAPIGKTC